MFSCRILFADEFRGHFLKDMKKTVFLVLELKKFFRKRVDLTKQKHEPMCKLNIMKNEISLLCPGFEKLYTIFLYHDGCHFAGLYNIVSLIRNQLL